MAASQFGPLTPLQQYNQQPPSQQQQQQQLQQRQQQQTAPPQPSLQQQHYGTQLSFQPIPQPVPPPPPLLSQQQRQQQQHPQQQHHQQQQQQQSTTAAPVLPSNPPLQNSTHSRFQVQPESPALNGTAAGPLQPRQLHDPGPTLTSASAPALNAGSANPTSPSTINAAGDGSEQPRRSVGRPLKRRNGDRDRAAAVEANPSAPAPPAAHPLSKGPYDTLEDAIFSLQLHVFTSGYGVSQKRTVKEKLPSGRYDPEGDVIRKDFACDKGGNEFVSQSRGERRRESKKCGCPWKAAIRRLRREGDRWFIEILDEHHNHAATQPDLMHTLASYRRWQRENNAGIRAAIARLARAAALPARDIAAYLRGDVADPDLDRIDKQILRALSMSEKEVPGNEKQGGSVAFEILARRPVIILQDHDRPATFNGHPSASNPPNPPLTPTALPNPPAQQGPLHDPAAYHPSFVSPFAAAPPPPVGGGGGATGIHPGYAVPS
ncbi:hypothetical protein F4777DRAFT_539173 [Nemania sp. FL0916]|nr:hypothetical protein F4777DRAFT_539173 [Nemania sp. FL0916]